MSLLTLKYSVDNEILICDFFFFMHCVVFIKLIFSIWQNRDALELGGYRQNFREMIKQKHCSAFQTKICKNYSNSKCGSLGYNETQVHIKQQPIPKEQCSGLNENSMKSTFLSNKTLTITNIAKIPPHCGPKTSKQPQHASAETKQTN